MNAQLGLTGLAVVLLVAATVAEVRRRGRRLPAVTHLAAVAAMLWMLVPGTGGTAIGVAAALLGIAVARVLVAVARREAHATRRRTALQVVELLATALLLVVMPGHPDGGISGGGAAHGHAPAGSLASGVTIAVLAVWSAAVLVAALLRYRASRRHSPESARGLTSSACMVGAMSAMSVAALA